MKRKPYLHTELSTLTISITAAQRTAIQSIADSRFVYNAAIIREAIDHYLTTKCPQINPMAPQRADTPGAGSSAPERTAEGTGGQDEEVANAAE